MPAAKVDIVRAKTPPNDSLRIDAALVERWLTAFLHEEIVRRRGMQTAVVGISGGIDSAVVAYLCARALGPKSVVGVRMPYRTSSEESFAHAGLVIEQTGIRDLTIDISPAVDGYLRFAPDASPRRRGNVMARVRMTVLFDQSARFNGLPVGTGNKSERLLGYFTWHADDSPPINPIGDLFKVQVWQLARHLGVAQVIVDKPATADLIRGQTDEEDLGITYQKADHILQLLVSGYTEDDMIARGLDARDVKIVSDKVDSTHWKRHLPTTAVISPTAINEFYLRPVDY